MSKKSKKAKKHTKKFKDEKIHNGVLMKEKQSLEKPQGEITLNHVFSRETFKKYFSLPVLILGLILTLLFFFVFDRLVWLIPAGLVLTFILSYLIELLSSKLRKAKYLQLLEKHTDASFPEILERIRVMLVSPEEVESVHKLRVSIRRFRSLISLAKPRMRLNQYLKIQDFFRQRGKELAPLREMDVLIDVVENIPGLENSQIGERLKARRLDEQVAAVKLLTPQYINKLTEMKNVFLDEVRHASHRDFTEEFEDRVDDWDQYIFTRLHKVDDLPWDKVHRVRIKSKKARYIAEIFDEDIEEPYSSRRKEYKRIQSSLGDRCDQLRNLEAIDEWIESDNQQIIREKEIFKAYVRNEDIDPANYPITVQEEAFFESTALEEDLELEKEDLGLDTEKSEPNTNAEPSTDTEPNSDALKQEIDNPEF